MPGLVRAGELSLRKSQVLSKAGLIVNEQAGEGNANQSSDSHPAENPAQYPYFGSDVFHFGFQLPDIKF